MSVPPILEQAFRLQTAGKAAEAEKLYAQALRSIRDNPILWFNHGLVLRDMDRPRDALASFEQALRLAPQAAEIHSERGATLTDLGRFAEALPALEKAVAMKPGYAGALVNRGRALSEMHRIEEALASYEMALRFNPRLPVALSGRGGVLEKLGRFADAMASYNGALALNPQDVQALNGRGLLLAKLNREAEALADYERALAINPSLVAVQFNRATILTSLKRTAEAHAAFQRIQAQHPSYPFALDGLWGTTLHLCDWATRRELEPRLPAHVRAGQPLTPFNLLLCLDDPALQRQSATSFTRTAVNTPSAPPRKAAPHNGHLRIGYLSYDFRYHPVASSNAAVLERHDRTRFEVFAFSTGPNDASAMRARLEKGFEHFHDLSGRGDRDVAAQIAAANLDVLIDLGGHTTGARPGVLALRPAPVQVNYQGWPSTMGADFMDYILADGTVIPPGQEGAFAETVARLPHCYMPSDPTRAIAATPTRAQAGLPEQGFVFCAFNSCWKITPALFDIWMQLLQAVPGSVLWLRIDGEEPIANLRREAEACGVAPERLVVAPRAEEADHLARHRLADLFLDTYPFTGHSTAIDALWSGLPLVALVGQSFASRVSASVLKSAGVPEFAVATMQDYRALALALATDDQARAQYRNRLAMAQTAPLFDATGLTRALEAAYVRMADIARAGNRPEAFTIEG